MEEVSNSCESPTTVVCDFHQPEAGKNLDTAKRGKLLQGTISLVCELLLQGLAQTCSGSSPFTSSFTLSIIREGARDSILWSARIGMHVIATPSSNSHQSFSPHPFQYNHLTECHKQREEDSVSFTKVGYIPKIRLPYRCLQGLQEPSETRSTCAQPGRHNQQKMLYFMLLSTVCSSYSFFQLADDYNGCGQDNATDVQANRIPKNANPAN
jgi:hypothetical protein